MTPENGINQKGGTMKHKLVVSSRPFVHRSILDHIGLILVMYSVYSQSSA